MKVLSKNPFLIIGLLFLFCLGCLASFNLMLDLLSASKQRETILSSVKENYSTDFPQSFPAIAQGTPPNFNEIDSDLLFFEIPDSSPPAKWTQSDYMNVANELLRYVDSEIINDTSLIRTLHFSLPCHDISFGLQVVDIRLYRYTLIGDEKSRVELGVDIFPKKRFISWSETEYFPSLNSQATIELGDIDISADQALKIAEANGGQQVRELANNVCDINISLAGGILNNDWLVIYEGDSNITIFSITIDEKTGKFNING